MLSERLASGTPEVVAIAYSIATHLGHHIPAQDENAIIYECLIHDITDAVMVKEGFSPTTPLPFTLFHHRTFVCRVWEDSIRHTQNRAINSDTDTFEGATNLRCHGLA
jgi:hypothetical protein